MKKIKKTIHHIRARASATREDIRGGISAARNCIKGKFSAMRKSNRETTSEAVPEAVPAASEVQHESDQAIELVPTPQKMPDTYMYASSDTPLCYVAPYTDVNFKERTWLSFGADWPSFENRFDEDMRRHPPEMVVDRSSPCPFNWLPLNVRAKIWKYAFGDTKQAIFLKKDGITPKIPCSMRFVSWEWMSETWFAWVNSMSNRTLVVVDFPQHAYLGPPCPILRDLSTIRLRTLKLTLGDKDAETAAKRNRQFMRFVSKHRDDGFVATRTLIIELRKNWTAGGLTELDLGSLLACGAFAHFERIRIHGWITSESLDRLLKRARRMAQAAL
ncbi:hypothetical protein N7491_003908 [Penicillium cf. griseofulvum]|uniref:Uncharacterized protein n=1 Tax=Penicillium cf. griseofulvum TaxID=2972120 RepID=A0A9W9MQ49_9EURO|nr:hypothetical protein N7472_001914 [Penicillium cf. griseofulvum]KAJ5437355.1 hypothetical protein N7445_005899 [Penicillium cf. griseofulvum]KAJ5441502.1 hypothetical protein N7491_003908 [Penicillium cf. griseofulvum]